MKRQVLFLFGSQACVPGDPLLAARGLGCATAVLARAMPCGLAAGNVDYFETVRMEAPDEVVATARALQARKPVHAVIAYDDQAVPVAARVAAELGLPGHPVAAADASRDKALMKEHFERAGVPIAPYTLARNEEDAVRWAADHGYPVVVKPVRGSASQGVIRADSERELRQAYRRLRRIVLQQGLDTGGRSDAEHLVEAYLDGTEVSVELLVSHGEPSVLCVFEKPQPLAGPFFEETIYVTPPRLARERVEEIERLALRAVAALGLRHGPAHCEIRLSSSGLFVLEIGARLIGGACSRVFRYVLDEDIHAQVIRLAMGDRLRPPGRRPGAAGAMMLPIPREGRLLGMRGLEEAEAVPGIEDVIVNASPGDIIVPFPEQSCYVGFLTAAAGSPAEVEEALTTASGCIQLDLEPLDCEHWIYDIGDSCDSCSCGPPSHEHGIRTLEGLTLEEAQETVSPIIARSMFTELPFDLALAEARHCIRWLLEGRRGETSPALWLVAGDDGVALGSLAGETCYTSCLGVVPGRRRSGLGEALVRSILALGAQHGCVQMRAETDPRQQSSGKLFRHLGFRPEASSPRACCAC
jgi:biotin carboxylase/GNAT superfamily N-acetyltransferase